MDCELEGSEHVITLQFMQDRPGETYPHSAYGRHPEARCHRCMKRFDIATLEVTWVATGDGWSTLGYRVKR